MPEDEIRFDGGWPGAERKLLCLEPVDSYPASPLCCVRLQCRALPGAQLPMHKDYLGSLMGLELRREALGDIVLPEDQLGVAYVFALEPAAELICQELRQAGHTDLTAEMQPLESLPAIVNAVFMFCLLFSINFVERQKVVPPICRCFYLYLRLCAEGVRAPAPCARRS